MPDLKIFISSPGDVPDERLRADLIVDKLAQDYSRFFTLSTYRWEHEPMLASGHFQDAIEPPSAADILLLIVWARLGTPLPEKTALRDYRGIDGRVPVTGTEWEFEDALAAARARGTPQILAFRNTRPAPIDTCDPQARARSLAQLDALDRFWRRHFADEGVLIGAAETYQTLDAFARILEQKLRKLIERRIATLVASEPTAAGPVWHGSPFRGLQAYEFEHAPIFFGRDAMVALAARHIAMAARYGNAFLLVAGASGSGKSSLVKAALVPRLMKPQRIEGLAFLRRIVFRPSDAAGDIMLGLATALVEDKRRQGVGLPELLAPGQSAADLAGHLRAIAGAPAFAFGAALARITEDARRAGMILAHEDARAILVVDQLEELFTRETITPDDRRRFVDLLAGLAKSGLVWIIATIRSDFWHRTGDLPELLALAAGERRLDLTAPSPLELADMIRKPVEAAGLAFEVDHDSGIGLDADLAKRAATEPGVLPLLSFTLEAIFAEDVVARNGRILTYATYKSLGGLEGAIATRAEEIVDSLQDGAQAAVPRVLRALTTVSDGVDAIAVARTAPLDGFPPGSDARRVVDALTAGRLLIASSGGGHGTVRVAHEALIARWKRAEAQVALDRRDLETRKLVERQFERWSNAAAATRGNLLLHDPDLTNAVDLETRWGEDLDDEHRAFIARSVATKQAVTRRRWLAAGVVIALLAAFAALSVTGLVVAEVQRDDALMAQSRALARDAAAVTAQGDTTLAMLLALAALPRSLDNPDRPFVRDAEYPLADAFANRRERAVLRNDGDVNAITFSPDGRLLAVGSEAPTAILWDATTGRRSKELVGHTKGVNSIDFSADGHRILTASDDETARVWDSTTGHELARLHACASKVLSASFSHDGSRIVATCFDGTATVFDADADVRRATLSMGVLAAAFSPDGTKVATASDDGKTRIWSVGGTLLQTLAGPDAQGTVVSFSPDGRRLVAAADDGSARVFDVATSARLSVFDRHSARINSAIFAPDGKTVLTASDDHTAQIWNAETGAPVMPLLGHEGIVYAAAFSSDGRRVVTASKDETARIWDARTGVTTAVLGGHKGPVIAALFAPDGHGLATASHEPLARLWNADTSATIAVLRVDTPSVVGALSADGAHIATNAKDGGLQIWDGRAGTRLAAWPSTAGTVRSVAFSPDGRFVATGSSARTARVWNVTTGTSRPLVGHEGAVATARFSPDGRKVATASDDRTARLWDAFTGKELHVLHHGDVVNDAVFGPSGTRVVTVSSDGTAGLWDASSGDRIATLQGPGGFLKAATFAPDGHRIATGGGEGATLWNETTHAAIAPLGPRGNWVKSVAFSSDGAIVATASIDHEVRLWRALDGTFLRTLTGHRLPVQSVAFSPDGRHLATASDDRTSRYWDATTGATIAVLTGHESGVTSAAFSSDGTRVLTTATDGTARLWAVPPVCQALIDAARRALPRDLTADERARYFLTRREGGWLERLHALSAPLLALIVPKAGDSCR